jgi:glycosyltransferase involved in cell wall biosynthesis
MASMALNTPRRILVLNYEFPPLGGGASPVSYEIAHKLSLTGDFDIDVVTMGYKGLSKYEEVNSHFRIHRVPSIRSKKEICHPWEQLSYLFTGYWKARQLIKKHHYDVCHTHFIIPTGVIARRLKKEFGLPYIITAHGSDVLGYNARFKKLYPFLIKPWRNILDSAKLITSPSLFLKNEILKVYPEFDEKKIEVIPNGIDTTKFIPQEKKKYIFSSGRLLVNKGFQYLIQAVSDVDFGYEVHIAGDGPMMHELQNLAEKSKTKVVLHGWLDNRGQEYKNLLEQASIYVLASDKENASIALLEAMSAGCAVVTTNISGTAEMVNGTGLLVNPKDVQDLKSAISTVTSGESLLSDLQQKSLTRINDVYSWGVVLDKYKQVI